MNCVSSRMCHGLPEQVTVLLINPPTRNIEYPPLSLAVLSAAIKSKGVPCGVMDANALMKRWLLMPESLSVVANEDGARLASSYRGVPEAMRGAAAIGSELRMAAEQAGGYGRLADAAKNMRNLDTNGIFVWPNAVEGVSAVFRALRCLHSYLDLCARALLLKLPNGADTLAGKLYLEVAEAVASVHPRVVGITAMSPQRLGTLCLARLLKSHTDAKVVVGGSDPSKFPEGYLSDEYPIDSVFVGDSTIALPVYVESLNSPHVPRVVGKMEPFVSGGGTSTTAYACPPAVDYSSFNLDLYLYPVLPIRTSRGCSWGRCDFCDHWHHSPTYICFDADAVVEQIVQARAMTGIRCFHLADDELEVAHGTEVFRRLARECSDVRVMTYARFDQRINADTLEVWRDGGVRVIEWGLESGSQALLDKMGKGIRVSQAVRILHESAAVGITNKLMMFHNHPAENIADLLTSLGLLKDLLKDGVIRPFFPVRTKFELRNGTSLYARADDTSLFRKVWWPDGSFKERCEYSQDVEEYGRKVANLEGFLRYANQVMVDHGVVGTDDENMCMDLVVRQMQDDGIPITLSSL